MSKKILLVRNDKLGDFMLAWPAFAMLKASAPEWNLTALVPSYTESLARLCPYLDDVIIDAGPEGDRSAKEKTLFAIKSAKFDASIHFVSNPYNGWLAFRSGIPFRLAPATKWVQIFYHHRIWQRRSQSIKPEYEYNLDLVRAFLHKLNRPIVEPSSPYLSFSDNILKEQRAKLIKTFGLPEDKPWVYVHVGTGGSANNLSLSQYATIIRAFIEQQKMSVVLTAGPTEVEKAQEVCRMVQHSQVFIYDKNEGLVDFARSLACASLFISGSTGPLHICGALDIPTIAFYPSKRSATPLRWKTTNSSTKHLAFSPEKTKETQDDLTSINVQAILPSIFDFVDTL